MIVSHINYTKKCESAVNNSNCSILLSFSIDGSFSDASQLMINRHLKKKKRLSLNIFGRLKCNRKKRQAPKVGNISHS